MNTTVVALCVIVAGCSPPADTPATTPNPHYEIGATEYSDLAVKSLSAWTQLDFDAWAVTMSDDAEFYFPDGDAETRTSLTGKAAVLDWWRNWKMTSGIQSMTYRDHVDIPVIAKETLPYTGLRGPLVISYFSNELVYSAATVKIRMNVAIHFNSEKLIDRFYTYYDRTGIIEATKTNILKK
jgi:hypothetical protein